MMIGCSSSESISSIPNERYGLTEDQYVYVKSETVPGGKLDFENQFSNQQLILIGNVAYNKKDAAIYTWALAIKKLCIKNANDAIELYETLLDIKLRDTQKKAIQNAFNKKD